MNTRYLSSLCHWLSIPDDDAITAADHYYQSTRARKVRRLIFCLDMSEETALANSLMDCAEPLAGMYCIYTLYTFHMSM